MITEYSLTALMGGMWRGGFLTFCIFIDPILIIRVVLLFLNIVNNIIIMNR